MRILIPVLSPAYADESFVQRFTPDASVIYVLLVLDANSASAKFGFKTSEILSGRETVDKVKETIKNQKRLCSDILEWGPTVEKITQIAEMKQVDKIALYNAENNVHFSHFVNDIQKRTKIPVDVVPGKAKEK